MGRAGHKTVRRRRVLLVDDHPLVRAGLTRTIERTTDLTVCAEAATVDEALERVERTGPEVAVVDLTLETESGLDLVKQLKGRWPDMPVLVLSFHDERLYGGRARSLGASGYVSKDASPQEVLEGIRTVLAGQAHFLGSHAGEPENEIAALTNRELQVLELLGEGRSTRDTAASLCVSVKTIETHRQNIKHKLGLATAAELMHYAIKWRERRHGA